MHYITYRGRTVNILKCSACRSYSLQLKSLDQPDPDEKWTRYKFTCEKCSATGHVRISTNVNLEAFDSWENLQDRIDELKVAMTLTELHLHPDTNNSD